MKGYERLVSNNWERIQLAGFPDESRGKITPLMMEEVHSRVYTRCYRRQTLLFSVHNSVFTIITAPGRGTQPRL